jgi:hypothetical protein
VKHSKNYGKSIIHDYKIDHADNSTVELFFVGEALDDDTKALIYETAEKYDIKRESIILTNNTATEDIDEIEMVKGIYDRMDVEIDTRDKEIKRLKTELKTYEDNRIPYRQLTREIANNYPAISEVHITRGESVLTENNDNTTLSMIVVVRTTESIDNDTHTKLENWLKIRLNEENIILFTLPANAE